MLIVKQLYTSNTHAPDASPGRKVNRCAYRATVRFISIQNLFIVTGSCLRLQSIDIQHLYACLLQSIEIQHL